VHFVPASIVESDASGRSLDRFQWLSPGRGRRAHGHSGNIILLQGILRIAFWWIDSGSGSGFPAGSKCSPRHLVLSHIIPKGSGKATSQRTILLAKSINDQIPLKGEMQDRRRANRCESKYRCPPVISWAFHPSSNAKIEPTIIYCATSERSRSPSVVSEATAEEELRSLENVGRSLLIQRLEGSRPAVRSGAVAMGFR
jgi:hypothetical protein